MRAFRMKVLTFVIIATVFEAVGDAVMRIALQSPYALRGRIALFALASVLLTMYGMFLNLAPVEFATVTGIYLASLFIAFQIVNYLFFRHTPGPGVLLGGAFILAGAAIINFWK
jgi:drug/metabolite transporter (DMT)-like permease